MYKEFNEIEMDLTEYGEQPLTKLEQKRLKHRIVKQLPRRRRRGYGVGVAAILAISLVVFNHQTIANMPFVADVLEDWRTEQEVDWVNYKNAVGQTMTTQLGALTVNEVLIDYDKVLVSATLQTTENLAFSYRHQLLPTILVEGQSVEIIGGNAQSIEQNNEMFTIYNEIKLSRPIEAAEVSMQLSYNRILTPDTEQRLGELLAEPWTFDLVATQLAVQQKTINHTINQRIELLNGQSLVIDRIVTTPISTTIYYSDSNFNQSPDISLYDIDGKRYHWQSASSEDDGSGVLDFPGASFVGKQMYMEVSKDGEKISDRILVIQH